MKLKVRIVLMLTATIFLCSGNVSASSNFEPYTYTNDELSFRQQFGLDTDISKVIENKSKEDNLMVNSKFGVRMTKLEEVRLTERINHQTTKLPLIKDYLDKRTKDGIVFIDQKSGGIVNIGIKNSTNIDQYESDFRNIYGDSHLINVFIAKYSEKELNELNDKLISLMDTTFNGVTITDTLVDLAEQKVQVGIKDFDETKRSILEKTFNADMLSLRNSAVVSDDLDRNSTYNPLQAGTKIINNSTGGYCSIGFLTSNFIVTAAHCGSAGNSFSQGSNGVGSMGGRTYGGNVDAAVIGTTSLSYSNDLYTSSSRAGYFDTVQANDFVGNMVCMSGASSATNPVSCGTLLSKSVSYSVDGVGFSGLRSASYTSAPGDSGAPTYYSTVLMGINKGRYNGNAVYSYIGNVMNSLSVQPLLK